MPRIRAPECAPKVVDWPIGLDITRGDIIETIKRGSPKATPLRHRQSRRKVIHNLIQHTDYYGRVAAKFASKGRAADRASQAIEVLGASDSLNRHVPGSTSQHGDIVLVNPSVAAAKIAGTDVWPEKCA